MSDRTSRRPSVFIGSSVTGGLPVAKAIQQNLDRACEVVIWSQGVFGLGGGTLEDLVSKLHEFDFAVLVLTPDDTVLKKSKKVQQPRDNVLLELGLFIGSIGRERTFIVYDRTASLSLPTDLAGVTPATYQVHSDGNLLASLGAPSTVIEGAISKLGPRPEPKISFDVDQNTHFQVIADLLENSALQYIILMYVECRAIPRDRTYAPGFDYIYEQDDHSAGQGGFSVAEMCRKLADADLLSQDLRGNVSLTARGRDFGKWLVEHTRKARFFRCPFGGWGNPSRDLSKLMVAPMQASAPLAANSRNAPASGNDRPTAADQSAATSNPNASEKLSTTASKLPPVRAKKQAKIRGHSPLVTVNRKR